MAALTGAGVGAACGGRRHGQSGEDRSGDEEAGEPSYPSLSVTAVPLHPAWGIFPGSGVGSQVRPGSPFAGAMPMHKGTGPVARPTMQPSPPITVAIARFDDLLALGLRALLADDPALSVVAQDVDHDRLSQTLRDRRPDVLIADAGALRDVAQVRELSVGHPDTHLVLFAEDVATAERAQLLAFGASACLSWNTQARDVRNTIHLASRGMQVTPLASDGRNGTPGGSRG